MSNLIFPEGYKSLLGEKETEHAIVLIKDFFQLQLSTALNLTRVTAPLFVESGKGLNDDLNGIERAVKTLVDVVCLCPKDLPGTSILGGGADLVNPAAM